ncbi:Uncharacterised protein [uncultured archaeon]|nr:Uncharacterised protein [uncultured archaeon]
MIKKPFRIIHDLSVLQTRAEVDAYLAEVSAYVGLPPELNAFDTIWMDNEGAPGKSLVVYARRGTAEILRDKLGIEVDSLTDKMVNSSIVYTAAGHTNHPDTGRPLRHEIAIGSKNLHALQGKALDDAIMTASTRALRRLTMQFTTLGILDESEVKASINDVVNPAAGALPAVNNTPSIFIPSMTPNNSSGKDITPEHERNQPEIIGKEQLTTHLDHTAKPEEPFLGQKSQIDAAMNQVKEKQAGAQAENASPQPDAEIAKPKRARKPKNAVSMVEPETVSTKQPASTTSEKIIAPPAPAPAQAPPVSAATTEQAPLVQSAPVPALFSGQPSPEQLAEYRKKISVYTAQLPASESMGSVAKMRAFITQTSGFAPQAMTVGQWNELLAWFEEFVARNQVKGLINYINTCLGVK